MSRLLICLVMVTFTCYVLVTSCHLPWLKYKDNCYYFYNVSSTLRPKSWNESRMICQILGGDLLSIVDMEEQKFINSFFKDTSIKRLNYWIGLTDSRKEGVFEWIDGTVFNSSIFNYWRKESGEPNNYKNNEDCAETTWDGKWNDNNCQTQFGFVCKRKSDANPKKPTLPPYPDTTDKPTTCEAGWIPWGTSCYGIIKGIPKTWQDARADCLRRFGDLLIIDSQAENDFITYQLIPLQSEYWIGLTDQGLVKGFHWVDGTPLNKTLYVNWRPGEPSNSFQNEDCVEMYGHWRPGKWNDNHCTSIRDYICEKKSGVHNCPDGWFTYRDYCYQLNAHPNQKTTWKEARRVCLDFNKPWKDNIDVAKADLVSIHSTDEQKYLDSQFRALGVKDSTDYYWTGLVNKSNKFEWTDHSNYDYQNWKSQSIDSSKNCTKTSLSLFGLGWEASYCNEKNYYVCKVRRGQDRCYDPIGIQNFKIPDSSFTASSQMAITTPPFAAKLYLKAGNFLDGAWCAAKNDKEPWIQINFGKPERLTYMAIQGKSNSQAIVLGYYIKYSMDGISWDTYGDVPPAGYIKFKIRLSWRNDFEKALNLPFPHPLNAQYVRIYPIKSECHEDCCMRFEFYGCSTEVNSQYCGMGWKRDPISKHCYQLNTKRTTWDAAESLCLAQGSHLLSFTSYQERDFIKNLLKPMSGRVDEFWIGLTDQDEEGVFRFSDQSPIVVDFWQRYAYHKSDVSKNCYAVNSADGRWDNKDCTEFREFICKKSYASFYTPKASFNGNIASSADLFWQMDKIVKNKVDGTLPMNAYGKIMSIPFNGDQDVHYLEFDGESSYLNSPSLEGTCASHPDSSFCQHGLSVSFVFKYNGKATMATILDTLGDNVDSVGFKVYIQNKQIVTMLRGAEKYYTSLDDFTSGVWHHFTFTWFPLDGLKVYLDGIRTSADANHGAYNQRHLSKEIVKTLFVGKSASYSKFAKLGMGALSIYERILPSAEIKASYLSLFGKCGPGQVSHGSYCYEFNTNRLNWYSANADCQMKGGSLSSIHSSVEQSFIAYISGSTNLNMSMWIGFTRSLDKPYKWTDGSDIPFTAWKSGEPYTGILMRDVHVRIEKDTGKWSPAYSSSKLGYICKFQRVMNPAKKYAVMNPIISYYATRFIGCPFTQRMQILDVFYGTRSGKKCYMDKEKAKHIISKICSGRSCAVKASDSYLNTISCSSMGWKILNISYTCVKDEVTKPSNCARYETSADGLRCYKLFTEKLSFSDADKQCKNENAMLATLSGLDDQHLLTSMISKLTSQSDIWVGLEYNDKIREYQWVNGLPVTYTKWINKQPNPNLGKLVKVGVDTGLQPMMWKPANGSEKLPFFCQKMSGQTTTASPTTSPPSPQPSCHTSWVEYKGACYFYNAKLLSFVDAERNCSTLIRNAHAVSIMDIEENDFVLGLIYNVTGGDDILTWLGLENKGLINGFRWTDGNPLYYVNWYPLRPYSGNRHLCGGMENNGQWFDVPCYTKYPSICKIPKVGLPAQTTPITTISTVTLPPSMKCDSGWKEFNRSCYYFPQGYIRRDFHKASEDCHSRNASLASVLNEQENNFIQSERKKHFYSYTKMFIGLRDTSSGWKWSDGSPTNYLNFDDRLPDNLHGLEGCVEMKSNGRWDDVPCNIKAHYVCKIDKVKNVVPTPVVPKDGGFCDHGWKLYGNHCYLFQLNEDEEKNFKDARDFCETLHKSELVSVHNRYENAFISGQAKGNVINMYIGLTDSLRERTFLWTDQSSVEYANWARGEPSFYHDEDCVEIRTYYHSFGQWNDIDCEKTNGFVCKKLSSSKKPSGTPPPDKDPCPAGFKKYGRSCYYFAKEAKNWRKAVESCRQKSSSLLSVVSIYENAYLFSQFVEYTNQSWLGLSREKGKEEFKYEDGSILLYTFWKSEPASTAVNETQCVTQSAEEDGKWKISNCFKKFPYICKINREPVIEPLFVGNCSVEWHQYNGMCYKYFKDKKMNWPQARKKCNAHGGELATVKSYGIQKFLEFITKEEIERTWIGLNDRDKEHLFTWSSGTAFNRKTSFSNWNFGEPNDGVGKENCVEMLTSHGKWNDLPCSYELNYLCEHRLECQDPAGFENGNITDKNFVATSSYSTSSSHNARLNGESAWCTDITYGNESLTVNLLKFMHITRISTQGGHATVDKYGSVISYQLEYSIDGNEWHVYTLHTEDGSSSQLLPGNSDASVSVIHSNKVDIKATYLRFTPKAFKGDLMCMRIEVYGCKSVCLNPLTALSSSFVTSNSREVRIARPPTLLYDAFCVKTLVAEVFYQLTFKVPIKVNRFTVQSQGKTFKYRLMFHMDGKNKTLETEYDSRVSTYRLDIGFIADQINIVLVDPLEDLCLRAEFYGCLYECDSELGLHSKKLPDYLMLAKSEKPGFPASAGRLDGGYYNRNSWCAAVNDFQQYLQIDLTQQVHVTGIATQGFYGSELRYVSKYLLQWSNDGDLWIQYQGEISANHGGESTVKNKITPAIHARYVRIIPTEFENEICMRVELYGCSFDISGVVPPSKGESSDVDTSLSNGGKIGLIVFFVLLIIIAIVVGVVYFMRHQRSGFTLQKSFSNPVHMDINNDEIDIINYAE